MGYKRTKIFFKPIIAEYKIFLIFCSELFFLFHGSLSLTYLFKAEEYECIFFK